MKKWCVYMHLFPNGKRYIGITSKKPKARWENGSGYDKNRQPIVYNAIQKYGWDNIEHIILFDGITESEAKRKEIELIAKYKTNTAKYGTEFGYNMTDGGEGTTGHIVTEEARRKMSDARVGKYNGDECYKSRAVVCCGVRYSTISGFCKKNNLCRRTVEAWLNGKTKMQKEWFDKGLRYENQECEIICQEKPWNNKILYDDIVFKSQAELAKYLGISPSGLLKRIKSGKIHVN